MKRETCIRNIFIGLMTALLLSVGGMCPVLAEEVKATAAVPAVEEEKPTAQLDVSALTKYVWRGQELTRDSIVIQPSLTVGYKGFTVNMWGNLDTNPYSTSGKSYASTWTETDLTLAYNKTFGPVTAGVGYIYYGLGPANKDTAKPPDAQEVFATITLNKLLSPTLTLYREVDHYRQWYALFAISHTVEFNKIVSLKLAASASYLKAEYADANLFNTANGYGGYPKFNSQAQATNDKFDNFHDGVVTASLPITAVKYITITPTISYVFPLTNDAKYEMQGRGIKSVTNNTDRDSSFLYGGLTLTFSF
jgi:hypothetical protein